MAKQLIRKVEKRAKALRSTQSSPFPPESICAVERQSRDVSRALQAPSTLEARLQDKHQIPQTLVYWQGARDGLETLRKRVAKRARVGFSALCPKHVMLVFTFKDEMWAIGRRTAAIVHVTLFADSADLGQQKSM